MDKNKYRLVTLNELLTVDVSCKYRPLPKEVYSRLRDGSLVKVYAEAVGGEHKAPECFWVIVLNRSGPNFKGRIDNPLGRTAQHSLAYGDIIDFHKQHIVNVGLTK